jgi:hypothetical protein
MFFLNLALGQLLMLAGAASAITVALYLLDRSRRRQIVSTLRFFPREVVTQDKARRRHIQQPVSLILQLAGIFLLLLAVAQPRFGSPFRKTNYQVLVLDTSSWMGARDGDHTVMDTARARANEWLARLPAADRVMLLRADSLATPATAFEIDRQNIRRAIAASQAGSTALDINGAIAAARQALNNHGSIGEIVYIGAARVRADQSMPPQVRNLRVITVPSPTENAGLKRISVKPSVTEPGTWDVLVSVRNYGSRRRALGVTMGFDGAPAGGERITLGPGADHDLQFPLRTRQAGLLEARISPGDAFPADDHAELAVPAVPQLPVIVYTDRAATLRPLLAANPRLKPEFRTRAQYRADDRAVVILDQFRPVPPPQSNAIFILPTGSNTLQKGSSGVVMSAGPPKTAIVRFDPGLPGARFELSTPLQFAKVLRWIEPETFRDSGHSVESTGNVTVPIDAGEANNISVRHQNGAAVPFAIENHTLRFFAGSPETVTVSVDGRETGYQLTLPEMWDSVWSPPATATRGLPPGHYVADQRELWPWLALLGAACLIAEWLLFAQSQRKPIRAMPQRTELRRAS